MRIHLHRAACAVASLLACSAAMAQALAPSQPEAPLKQFGASQPVRGQYIVTLRPA